MADFNGEDLSGSRFVRVELSGSEFVDTDFSRSWFRGVEMRDVVMRGVELCDVNIDGEFKHLVLNGVDVAPLVEAELDRREPDRAKMRPTDPAGFREAWDIVERLSAVLPLQPGDLIFTGTPSGVGGGRTPKRFLVPGEEVVTWIEGIGALRQRCVPGTPHTTASAS